LHDPGDGSALLPGSPFARSRKKRGSPELVCWIEGEQGCRAAFRVLSRAAPATPKESQLQGAGSQGTCPGAKFSALNSFHFFVALPSSTLVQGPPSIETSLMNVKDVGGEGARLLTLNNQLSTLNFLITPASGGPRVLRSTLFDASAG
jgi:hypothetical protein